MKARTTAKKSKPPKKTTQRAGRKVIVELPAGLYAAAEEAVGKLSMNRSTLIRSALQEYLDNRRREELEKELAAGYVANAAQARATAEAFAHVDSELS